MRPREAHKNDRQERMRIDSPLHAQSKTKDLLVVSGIPCRSLVVDWFAQRVFPIMGYVGLREKGNVGKSFPSKRPEHLPASRVNTQLCQLEEIFCWSPKSVISMAKI